MHINWAFEYIPKLFFGLSLIFNPIFIYLNISDSRKVLGKYRFVLLAFSIFNSIYSIVEFAIPVAVYGRDQIVLVYLAEGPFEKNIFLGQLAVSIRCGFISLSYGILTIHFVYRYFALFDPKTNDKLTSKSGIFYLFLFFLSHGVVWTSICEFMLYSTTEARERVKDTFQERYDTDISEVSFINIMWKSSDKSSMIRCYTAIIILTLISAVSISLYCTLGYKIVRKLHSAKTISNNTKKLHRQLFKTLVIQTLIPLVISFMPCMVAWFLPFLGLDIWNYGNIGVVALSAFPFLDALAIILLLPVYRNRFKVSTTRDTSIRTISR